MCYNNNMNLRRRFGASKMHLTPWWFWSEALVLLVLIYCFMYPPTLFVCGVVLCWSFFWYSFLCVLSSFAIMGRGRKSCLLCFNCLSDGLLLLMFWGFYSWCHGLVCCVELWYSWSTSLTFTYKRDCNWSC